MKIIKTGSTYKIYGEDLVVLDKLPAQTYKVGFGQFTGFFLEQQENLEIKESKIYGVHEEKVHKIFNRYQKTLKNLGVILSGDKGIGKSLCAKLLTKTALENNMPVILVGDYIPGIEDFLNNIKDEVLVLFDEFDKTFSKQRDDDPQSKMLSLFDGTGYGKKLFVITCNDYTNLNEFLINRPGRFHFHLRFEYPTVEEVKEYLKDKLDKEYYSEISKVATFSRKIKLNYDCLSAIALELNEGEKFEEAIKDLNIINSSQNDNKYNVTVYTKEGITFTAINNRINFFQDTEVCVWAEENVRIYFKNTDVVYNDNKNIFTVPGDKINIAYDEEDIDEELRPIYKNLHFDYAEIVLTYGNNIHYVL